jgi:hypothetical protein
MGILDGMVVGIDRLGGDLDRLYYSGKAPPSRRQPAGTC